MASWIVPRGKYSTSPGDNVISKSGTTTETAIAFRFLYDLLKKKYKSNADRRVIATTDANKGALKTLATNNN